MTKDTAQLHTIFNFDCLECDKLIADMGGLSGGSFAFVKHVSVTFCALIQCVRQQVELRQMW